MTRVGVMFKNVVKVYLGETLDSALQKLESLGLVFEISRSSKHYPNTDIYVSKKSHNEFYQLHHVIRVLRSNRSIVHLGFYGVNQCIFIEYDNTVILGHKTRYFVENNRYLTVAELKRLPFYVKHNMSGTCVRPKPPTCSCSRVSKQCFGCAGIDVLKGSSLIIKYGDFNACLYESNVHGEGNHCIQLSVMDANFKRGIFIR